MVFFKNRKAAVVIAVAVCALALLFGVHKSVNKQSALIEQMFYDGVYLKDEGYTQPAIAEQLSKRASAALGLLTIASNHDGVEKEAEALRSARNGLLDTDSITEKALYNDKLESAYLAIKEKLDAASFTDSEKSAYDSYIGTLEGAERIIMNSRYNSAVSDYIRNTLKAFPVSILRGLAFCDTPELFGVEG